MNSIYRIQDVRTGEVYIGKTSRRLCIREREHFRALDRGTHHNVKLQEAHNDCPARLVFKKVCEIPVGQGFRDSDIEAAYVSAVGDKAMNTKRLNPFWLL